MSAGQRSAALRVPIAATDGSRLPPRDGGRPRLRLSLSRGQLSVELDEPARLGPLVVQELSASLRGVKFPVDLSGGVARFRHRRGQLELLRVDAPVDALQAGLAPRLRGLLGMTTPRLALGLTDDGVRVGVHDGRRALVFDVVVAPLDEDLRLLPVGARAIGLSTPAFAAAVRALRLMVGPIGEWALGAVVIRRAARRVARWLLPEAGGRAPSTAGVRFASPRITSTSVELCAELDAAPPELSRQALRALELVELTSSADDSALEGRLDDARFALMSALERAPRHPELSLRVASIDAAVGGRPEAGLSTLVDALSAVEAGVVGGELLEAVGDTDGACAAFSRAAEVEWFAPFASLSYLRAAGIATDLDRRIWLLDEAVTRAPGLDEARWARLGLRLELGDTRGALADAEHLEASARGSTDRHQVCRRLGDVFYASGHPEEAKRLYERSLRYVPDSPDAVAGLARTLSELGNARRAVDLLARAVALTERAGKRSHRLELELAKAIAETVGDLPAATARARQIPAGVDESYEARLLEARWRADLDDLAGAAVALSRLCDAVELLGGTVSADLVDRLTPLLVEAARLHEDRRDDPRAAKRCLGLLLRLRPRDRRAAAQLRRLAEAHPEPAPPTEPEDVDELASDDVAEAHPTEIPAPHELPVDVGALPFDLDVAGEGLESGDGELDAEDELRADQLTDKLRADPTDRAIALELCDVLGRLGRDMDLLALLSAQMEDADDSFRAVFAERRRDVLGRLAEAARAAGRDDEASLYEGLLGAD